jgi:hypothetical protein
MSGDRTAIVCARLDQPHVDGSIEETCGGCGRPIWLGPTMQLFRAATFATLLCWACAMKEGFTGEGANIHPGSLAEIAQYDQDHETNIGLIHVIDAVVNHGFKISP